MGLRHRYVQHVEQEVVDMAAMLGLRLDPATDQMLGRFAEKARRTKSEIARAAVREYIERHDLDAEFRRQVAALAAAERDAPDRELDAFLKAHVDAILRDLDREEEQEER
jgi:RHH-type rel operon transcriptional repressor/antitoxin RelB